MPEIERHSPATAVAGFARFAAEFFALSREKAALVDQMYPSLAAIGFDRREVMPGSPEAEVWLAVASHQLADWDLFVKYPIFGTHCLRLEIAF